MTVLLNILVFGGFVAFTHAIAQYSIRKVVRGLPCSTGINVVNSIQDQYLRKYKYKTFTFDRLNEAFVHVKALYDPDIVDVCDAPVMIYTMGTLGYEMNLLEEEEITINFVDKIARDSHMFLIQNNAQWQYISKNPYDKSFYLYSSSDYHKYDSNSDLLEAVSVFAAEYDVYSVKKSDLFLISHPPYRMYFERQIKRDCAQHAFDNALQGQFANITLFQSFVPILNAKYASLRPGSEEASRFIKQFGHPPYAVEGRTKEFNAGVLVYAAKEKGYAMTQLEPYDPSWTWLRRAFASVTDVTPYLKKVVQKSSIFILRDSDDHWYACSRIGKHFYQLNSEKVPKQESDYDVAEYFAQVMLEKFGKVYVLTPIN